MASKTPISANGIKPNSKQPPLSGEILKVARAALLDLPSAALKRIVAGGTDRDLYESAWTAYDSVIGLVNEATNRTYTNEGIGEFASRAIDLSIQFQRFNAAVAGAFFANLWPALNLPTATEIDGMRAELRSLREDLRGALAERESASTRRERDVVPELHLAAKRPGADRHDRPDRGSNVYQVAVWSGWPSTEQKEAQQNGRN